jgi:hypothetical protein
VNARIEIHLDVVVAIAAINAVEDLLVGQLFHVRVFVAVDAFQLAVNRFEKNGILNVQGNRFPRAYRLESRVVVAIETGVVVDGP